MMRQSWLYSAVICFRLLLASIYTSYVDCDTSFPPARRAHDCILVNLSRAVQSFDKTCFLTVNMSTHTRGDSQYSL